MLKSTIKLVQSLASLLQVQRLQQDQVRLEQAATEQINAALQEGLAAAAAAREEAEAGGSSNLQEALEREAQLTAVITDLQTEHEVSFLRSLTMEMQFDSFVWQPASR